MAGNYYHGMKGDWIKHCMENPGLYYQVPHTPPQQLFYPNMNPALNHMQLSHISPYPIIAPRTSGSTFNGSTGGSPHSDCHDPLTISPNAVNDKTLTTDKFHSPKNITPLQVFSSNKQQSDPDQPLDLSRSKHNTTSEHCAARNSRLANLLNRKRKTSDGNIQQQLGPLNLSKKTRLPSTLSVSRTNEQTIVDMKHAINNPVELVKLANQSHTAGKITHFMNQMICKLFTLHPFNDLKEADRISLVLNCWHRLLLWIYAENNFSFQVTQLTQNDKLKLESMSRKKSAHVNQPSMAFVKSIATFLHKYEELAVEKDEMSLLFAVTLFHSTADEAYEEPEKIAKHRTCLLARLQSLVQSKSSRTGGDKRYIDLLMYLPMLYGVNGKMVEELFCQHLSSNGDIKIMLKETIKSYSLSRQPVASTSF